MAKRHSQTMARKDIMTLRQEIEEIVIKSGCNNGWALYTEQIIEAFLKHLPEKKECPPIPTYEFLKAEGWNSYRNEIEGKLK